MTLLDWLNENKIGDAEFSDRIGVTRQAVHRYKTGKRRPEWGILRKIEKVTDGVVTPSDFLSESTSA